MLEANEKAVKAFEDIIGIVQQWEDGAITDEEMHNAIDLRIYDYRHKDAV